MKKNLVMRIAAVVLMCTLVTACFASSTFAKYASQATATDTATVAKWSFEVEGTEIVTTSQSDKETVTVDLINTILDTANGEAETDVAANKIAPGTKGAFDFDLQNKSEVTAKYTIAITPTLNGVPIKFYSDAACTTEITDLSKALTGTLAAVSAKITTTPIYWQWAYGDSVNDNALGINTPTVTFTADIVVTQVD